MASSGQPVKLSRPLDFLVVADHSDQMGFFPDLAAGKPNVLADPMGRKWYDMMNSGKAAEAAMDIVTVFSQGKFPPALIYSPTSLPYRNTWQDNIAAAEQFNEPGKFTALIGYEWTSLDAGNNLHRNVIFRDNGDKASQVEPYTTQAPFGSNNPVELWKWMDEYEKKTGGSVLAIAHNGNLSNGTYVPARRGVRQEDRSRSTSRPAQNGSDSTRPRRRKAMARHIHSCRPPTSLPTSRRWDNGNLDASVKKTKDMLQYEYVTIRPQNSASSSRRILAPTPTSSAWSAARTPTPACRRWKRTIFSAR